MLKLATSCKMSEARTGWCRYIWWKGIW